ncbi:MAG: translocation/assembly module TamB domain-containing protein, partial [Muribaculaceae bacterium]
MKRTNKILRWALRVAICLLLMTLLSPALLYVPFVQNIIKDFAIAKVSEATGWNISLNRILLKFPLSVSLDSLVIVTSPADTMIAAGNLSVSVKPLPLLRKELAIEGASLSDGRYHLLSEDESIDIKVAVDRCQFGITRIDLDHNAIVASTASLSGGRISLLSFPEKAVIAPDTAAAAPWLIKAASIKLHNIDYSMQMLPYIESLNAHVANAELLDGLVDMQRYLVDARHLGVSCLDCRYIYPDTIAAPSDSIPVAEDSMPWTVKANSITLSDSHAIYALSGHSPLNGLDMEYIEADSINIAINDFYNRGFAISVPVTSITARERCGFAIKSAHCTFEMDSTRLAVSNLSVANDQSFLKGSIESNTDFDRFDADIEASLSSADAHLLYPTIASMLPQGYPRSFNLSLAASGTMKRIDLTKCLLNLPGVARISAKGFASNIDDPKRLGCDIQFSGSTGNLNPMKSRLLADAELQRSVNLPPLSISGRAIASGNDYKGNLALSLQSGDVLLDAAWNGYRSAYKLQFDAASLPLNAIFPTAKLHLLTARGSVEGEGLDFFNKSTHLNADISIDTLFYNANRYYNVALRGSLANGDFNVNLDSRNPNCNFSTSASGKIEPNRFLFSLESDISDLNLTALRLMDFTSAGSCRMSVLGDIDMAQGCYDVTATIANLRWTFDDNFYYTDIIDASFVADSTHIDAQLANEDFSIDFDSECSLDSLTYKLSDISRVISKQISDKYLNSDSLRGRLPVMSCEIELGKHNLVQQYLLHSGVSYDKGNLMLANDSTFYMRGIIDRLKVNDIQIDTLRFGAVELNHRINWRIHAGNAREHIPGLARADLKGFINGSSLQAQLSQQNFDNRTGVNVGIAAELTDSTVRANIFPDVITIGYKPWTVSDGNFIAFNYATKHFDADLKLAQGNSLVALTTEHGKHSDTDSNAGENEDVHLVINNLPIADWLSISPYAPPVKGYLAADFSVKYNDSNIWGNGMIGVNDLYYGKQRVGSLRMNSLIDLNPASGGTMATANVEVDGKQCAVIFGALNDTVPDNRMTLSLELYKFPLRIANPFLPADMMNVKGYLNGMMTVDGTMERPNINGYLACDSASIAMPVFGSSITLPGDTIPVDSSIIRFRDYRIFALNDNPIVTSGTINMLNIFSPDINLRLRGNNVQFVNGKQMRKSQIFGKGFLDIDATARGNTDNINLNARLALLSGTNLTYVLQEDVNTIAARQEQQLVKFVQFNDSSYVVTEEKERTTMGNITLNADIQVQQGTSFTVFLSDNGKDRAEIVGNGDLRLAMNHLGDQTMTGRFNIDDGFVRYSPPLISQVDFKFNSGSYLLWTGDLMNPTLNLSATESRKANYTGADDNSRIVNFLVTLSVKNSLANMDVQFDLDAPDNLALHNELQSMSPAQRSSQAVNLLLYNTYTGLDSKATGNLSGNPLFSFVTSRINSWAASAMKGINVSFGLDNYTETHDGVSSRAIKYSYQVSKSLFNNRFKIVVGGDYTQGTTSSEEIAQNLFNDVSLEYMLNKSGNMLVRLFNHKGYINVLEGEVTETGVAFVYKRKLSNLRYLFSFLNPFA